MMNQFTGVGLATVKPCICLFWRPWALILTFLLLSFYFQYFITHNFLKNLHRASARSSVSHQLCRRTHVFKRQLRRILSRWKNKTKCRETMANQPCPKGVIKDQKDGYLEEERSKWVELSWGLRRDIGTWSGLWRIRRIWIWIRKELGGRGFARCWDSWEVKPETDSCMGKEGGWIILYCISSHSKM